MTQAEELTFARLLKNPRSSTNGWSIVEYCDTKRRAVAIALMHILRPHRTTYVTRQVGFTDRAVRGKSIHSAKIFYLVWINVGKRWGGASMNHMTSFLVNFYSGLGLLTKSGEKRFPKKRKILESDEDKESEEEKPKPKRPSEQ